MITGTMMTDVFFACEVVFHWRANRIRTRGAGGGVIGGFDDRFGPTVLTTALVAAVTVNFVLKVGFDPGNKG